MISHTSSGSSLELSSLRHLCVTMHPDHGKLINLNVRSPRSPPRWPGHKHNSGTVPFQIEVFLHRLSFSRLLAAPDVATSGE